MGYLYSAHLCYGEERGFFIFGKGATFEFLYRAASSLMMFASHPYGLGAVLAVYTQDQGTSKRIKRIALSVSGTPLLQN